MASDEEIRSLFKQFKKAYSRLKEALSIKEESDIKRDEEEAKKIYDFIKEKVINAFDMAERNISDKLES